jgi:hypothetical protein
MRGPGGVAVVCEMFLVALVDDAQAGEGEQFIYLRDKF